MNLQVIKNRVLLWLKRIVLYGLYIILILLITSFFILQIPAVQSNLSQRFLASFSNVVGFETTVEHVEFYWFDRVIVENIRIEDPEHNTMIGVKRLMVNFKFSGIFNDNNISLDAATIDSAEVNLKTIMDLDSTRDLNINIFVTRINQMSKSQGSGKGAEVTIGEAILSNSVFTYNTDRDSLLGIFDPNHFSIAIPDAELEKFLILGDTVQFNVRSLSATENRLDFTVHELSTFFLISQQRMELSGLKLKAGKSIISDTVIFSYKSQRDLQTFVDSVDVHATLTESSIHPQDLALFAPIPYQMTKPIVLSGEFNGRINNFRFTEMDLNVGDTHLRGSVDMDGLPDITETFIILSIKQSQINFTDLAFLFNENTSNALNSLGRLNFKGQFLGYPTDFVAAGDFSSEMGRIVSDINLKINEVNIEQSEYTGNLTLSNFNLGKYLNDTVNFQHVNVSGKLAGKGFTLESADFSLDGIVSSIGLKGYNYKNIATNARFSSRFFNGKISVNDPNLVFNAEGSVDLRNDLNQIKVKGSLSDAYFHKLNLTRKELFIRSELDIDMKGLELDSLLGNAQLKNAMIVYEKDSLSFENISLLAEKNDKERLLNLKSSLLDVEVKGDFYFSNLFRDIPVLGKELQLEIINDLQSINSYYERKNRLPEKYAVDFEFNLKDIEPIAHLFGIDLAMSRNSLITGRFTSGPTSILQAYTFIDTIALTSNLFYKTEFDINILKSSENREALAMVYVQSREQDLSHIKTNNLMTEIIWNREHMDVELTISQQATTNRFDLNGIIDFRDSTRIKLLPSTIRVLENEWSIHPGNSIAISGKEWTFNNVGFQQLNQSIMLNGFLSEDAERELLLTITNFDLANINPVITRKVEGLLDGEVILTNAYATKNIQNTVLIDNLKVDDFLFGKITGNNSWRADLQRFNVEFFIDRLNSRIVSCVGYYDPNNSKNPLAISANFNNANLKIFEPFIDDTFSQFQGTLTGIYTIRGELEAPKLSGEGKIENGGMVINYLNTKYLFKGSLGLTENSIYFKGIELTDAFRNKGTLNGAIRHTNFRAFEINLNAQFEDFQVLNTTAKDNSLFYGQAYASGEVNFSGPLNNLIISATATTRKNTRVYIPMSSSSSIDQKEYISFVNFNDSTYLASQEIDIGKKINLTGITIDFNLDVTPDAYCEIIFDLKAGDIIRGRGNGKIKLQLDTKGEFNMFGPIEFTEGWYNFTLYDIINKEFQIQPGSSIVWYGDPYQGTMKIDATYNQLASLAPIINDPTLTDEPALRRKYPVQVLLKLEGPMLSPIINFDIIADDLPKSVAVEGRPPVSLDLEFIAFKNKLDEQELKRQVFSLIILRRFSPPESFNTSGSLVNSVSELFSNQLSYWLSQMDENLEIDVDLGSMDQETFNTFQLRMSYTFMNGRLRVTRDGTVGNQAQNSSTTTNNNNDLANAIGDWTVDYLLSPDGKFKVKMYSRTNTTSLTNSLNSQNPFTTGVSLMHTQSFNTFKDLLRSSRDKNRRTLPDEEPSQEPNEDVLKEEDDGR